MLRVLGRFLRVEPGEGRLALGLWLSSLGHGLAVVACDLGANTMFLGELGAERLPHAFLTVAAIVPLAAALYAHMQKRVGLRALVTGTPICLALGFVAFYVLVSASERAPAVVFLLQPWLRLHFVLSEFSFWSTANRVLTLEQSKRLFGVIGTGEMLAYVIGYPALAALVPWLGLEPLLLIGAAFLCGNASLLGLMARHDRGALPPGQPGRVQRSAAPAAERAYRTTIAFMVASATLAYYVFAVAFYDRASGWYRDDAALAGFLGLFWSSTSVANLLVRSLGYARVMEEYGVRASLVVAPMVALVFAVCASAAGMLDAPSLVLFWVVAAGRWALEVVYATLGKLGVIVLYQPMAPAARLEAQTLVSSRAEPLGIALSGAVLSLLYALPGAGGQVLAGALVVLAGVWLWRTCLAMRGYGEALDRAMELSSEQAPDAVRPQVRGPGQAASGDRAATEARIRGAIADLLPVLRSLSDLHALSEPSPADTARMRALEDEREGARVRIVHALAGVLDPARLHHVLQNMGHPDADRRAYTVETLQVHLPGRLARLVLPALQGGPPARVLARLEAVLASRSAEAEPSSE